jgi:hypothetical protein
LPEPAYKLFESVSVLWRVLKPRKKIKGLAEVMAVMKSPGDGGQVSPGRALRASDPQAKNKTNGAKKI